MARLPLRRSVPVATTVGSGSSQMTGTWDNFNPGSTAANFLLHWSQVTTLQAATLRSRSSSTSPTRRRSRRGRRRPSPRTCQFLRLQFQPARSSPRGRTTTSRTQTTRPAVATVPSTGNYFRGDRAGLGARPPGTSNSSEGSITPAPSAVSQHVRLNAGGTYYPVHLTVTRSPPRRSAWAPRPWWATDTVPRPEPAPGERGASAPPGRDLIDLSPKGNADGLPAHPEPGRSRAPRTRVSNVGFFRGQWIGCRTRPVATPSDSRTTSTRRVRPDYNKFFYGTSQAAPDAAAVAALMLQANPSLSRVQILQALENDGRHR